ncbi:MAG: potassium transporter TrkG, partial [Candidatus Wallbacteria bacterium]|nr:potassium transporter TrkG [Candidatus Wallbacteria bacterium]
TVPGQMIILLLIQLGGLGIMSIATVAMHVMGHRLSLKQEYLLSSMADTDHKDLVRSLAIILKFTFSAELIGAVLLTSLFYTSGEEFLQALWRGIFTSISAFCNAGFALQSDSLISFQTNQFVLATVSFLIIFGGMAPATSLLVPKWITGKPVPIHIRVALLTSLILLLSGTVFLLSFEWNGILAGLSPAEKFQNAWFQSVTTRTAGFNSVEIAGMAGPSFLVMLAFMFIGGSPGGTAGGIKTTTIGILAMTFWANVTNRSDVITQNRKIQSSTINRAVTIVASGLIVWVLVVLMLEATQQIPVRDLIFEATSALGTVGLSTGATNALDEIGKIIIIIAMFAGRIGPMALFMLLSDGMTMTSSRYPEEKVYLT